MMYTQRPWETIMGDLIFRPLAFAAIWVLTLPSLILLFARASWGPFVEDFTLERAEHQAAIQRAIFGSIAIVVPFALRFPPPGGIMFAIMKIPVIAYVIWRWLKKFRFLRVKTMMV